MRYLFLSPALALACALVVTAAEAEQIGSYAGRSLTLGAGTVRLDAGPPDWGYFHPGGPQWIGENRGLRVRVDTQNDQTWVWAGLGLAVGATNELELGGLLLPIRVTPDTTYDDMELYGRYALLDGDFELGAQVSVQIPTETEAGLGLGLPMLVHATRDLRIDTGAELEILFWDPTVTNLDIPLALTWNVVGSGFLGFRTGVYVWDFDALIVPTGLHAGGVVADGRVDLGGWFMWPGFLHTDREHAVDLRTVEAGFGVNARID